jgi:hypothetical protein
MHTTDKRRVVFLLSAGLSGYIFVFCQISRLDRWLTPTIIQLIPGVQKPRREHDHSHLMLKWVYVSTSPPPPPYLYDVQRERILHFKFHYNIFTR